MGGRAPGAPPLDPPMQIYVLENERNYHTPTSSQWIHHWSSCNQQLCKFRQLESLMAVGYIWMLKNIFFQMYVFGKWKKLAHLPPPPPPNGSATGPDVTNNYASFASLNH